MSWVFYHCATITGLLSFNFLKYNILFPNLSHSLTVPAGLEPFILGLWVECSTNVLLLLAFFLSTLCHFHFTSYSKPLPVQAGFEPLIVISWVECSTTVLLPLAFFLSTFFIQYSIFQSQPLSTHASRSWTLDLRIMSWVFYHCATAFLQLHSTLLWVS